MTMEKRIYFLTLHLGVTLYWSRTEVAPDVLWVNTAVLSEHKVVLFPKKAFKMSAFFENGLKPISIGNQTFSKMRLNMYNICLISFTWILYDLKDLRLKCVWF